MTLNLFRICYRTFFIFIIYLTNFTSFVHSAEEWGWRKNLNVDVRMAGESLKIIRTHDLHNAMYTLETLISPYVQYSGHRKNTGHPANICMSAITVLVQCSPDLVCYLTIPIQNEYNEKIIFCSQKNSKLHGSFLATEKLAFSPEDSHPENATLQNFLETLRNPKFVSYDSHPSAFKKPRKTEGASREEHKTAELSSKKRPSNASSEGGGSSLASSGVFGMNFQHTEQKLVYYLLKNNGEKLRYHIHQALVKLSPAIRDNISLYYNNIIGLVLHAHTRLDVCTNCNDSLVLFRKNALTILNMPPEDYTSAAAEDTAGIAMSSATAEDIASVAVDVDAVSTSSFLPTINAPVLVTASSRARNDTNREITGYDEYWERDIDHKNNGHIVIQLKPETEIQIFEPIRDLGGIELININTASAMKKAESHAATQSSARVVDYTYTSPNCHSIFPDVLQRFVFK